MNSFVENYIQENNYCLLEYLGGHYHNRGQTANQLKNPLWKVMKERKEYLLSKVDLLKID